ncbi:MAG: hypothetical protein ABIJ91_01415 [Candidatus Kuenenbacteria bacterium]
MVKEKIKSIKIYIDPYGNTLNMWWGNPKNSVLSEEAEKSWDVICLDKNNRPIGLEKIGFFPKELDPIKYLKKKSKYLLRGYPESRFCSEIFKF